MNNVAKFEVEFISVEDSKVNLKYHANCKIELDIMRLHCLPYNKFKTENSIFINRVFSGEKVITLPLYKSDATGITFVVKDKTNEEQYSIGIDFKSKAVNYKKMTYGA